MSQHDGIISNDTGANVRSDLNNALGAIFTTHSGATEPSTTYSYQLWMDTSSNVLKIRNSANSAWYTLPISPIANNTVDINGGTVDGITSLTQTNVAADATDVELKYSGSTKLATTSTGIDVTGKAVVTEGSSGATPDTAADTLTIQNSSHAGLSILGGTTDSSRIAFGNSTTAVAGLINFNHTHNYLASYVGGSEAMRIANGGDISFYEDTGTTAKFFWDASAESLGIGTTSPYANLHVTGTIKVATGNAQGILALGEGNGSINNVGVWRGAANAPTTDGNYLNLGGYEGIVFATGAAAIGSQTERMRIDSSGNLLVGTTSTSIPNENSNAFLLGNLVNAHISGSASGSAYAIFGYAGSGIGSITQSGTTGVAYNTSSDYRLKEDWQPMTGSIDRLKALNPVNFAWKVDGSRVDGFLAHEAQEVVPEAVSGEKDAVEAIGNITDAEGTVIQENVTEPAELAEGQTWTKTEDRPVYQGIDQAKLVPLLTAALQEAVSKIEALETRIAALEA
jgi:hypothetical protein